MSSMLFLIIGGIIILVSIIYTLMVIGLSYFSLGLLDKTDSLTFRLVTGERKNTYRKNLVRGLGSTGLIFSGVFYLGLYLFYKGLADIIGLDVEFLFETTVYILCGLSWLLFITSSMIDFIKNGKEHPAICLMKFLGYGFIMFVYWLFALGFLIT